ncbi:hypothetical protein BAE44_0013847, partial [Dichanthelium oligosanthes]
LSKVAHMTVLKVSEAGTNDAGVLNSYLRGRPELTPDFVEFIADHPFTFLVKEEWSGVIAFAGHVLDPLQVISVRIQQIVSMHVYTLQSAK